MFSNRESIPKLMTTFNIFYNKTYNPCNFESFSKYTKEQLLALLIGIIDGDGNISKSKYSIYISITAHKN